MVQPTGDQCNNREQVGLPEGYDATYWRAFACWYPQMGGYGARCIVLVTKEAEECFEAYVWHDGEFPFSKEADNPVHIHHCSPEQFIEFGQFVESKVPHAN